VTFSVTFEISRFRLVRCVTAAEDKASFDDIIAAFKVALFPNPELNWRNAADMIQIKQKPTETVVDFING